MKNEKQVSEQRSKPEPITKDVISLAELEAALASEIRAVQSSYEALEASPYFPDTHPRVIARMVYEDRCEKAKMILKLSDQRLKLEACRQVQLREAL